MERDKDLLTSLIGFLQAHGYPENSFVMEYPIGGSYRADLAVVDPDTNKAIALFELKRRMTSESFKMALRQFETYTKSLGDEEIPIYFVFGKKGDPPFQLYYFKKENFGDIENQPIEIKEVPTFSIFRSSKISKAISDAAEKQEKTLTYYQIICWLAAFLFTILLMLDFLEKVNITPERLALIGVIAGLIIIPFSRKLKILGFEFERLKKKKEED